MTSSHSPMTSWSSDWSRFEASGAGRPRCSSSFSCAGSTSGPSTTSPCARAGPSRTSSKTCPRRALFRLKAKYFDPIELWRRGTAGAPPTPCYPLSRLATVPPTQPFDLDVGSRRSAVRIEKLARETDSVVVVKRPEAGGEVISRITQPCAAHVDQGTQLSAFDKDVRQAVVPMDQDMTWFWGGEGAAGGVGTVNFAQDLAEQARDACHRQPDRGVVERDTRDLASQQPIVAGRPVEADDLGHGPATGKPGEAIALAREVCRPLDVDGAGFSPEPPDGARPAHPRELAAQPGPADRGLRRRTHPPREPQSGR